METEQQKIELLPGQHVAICLHVMCCEYCDFHNDEQKQRCLAMDKEGNCRICPQKCAWSMHKTTPYIFKYVTTETTKTYNEMKERYERAEVQNITHKKFIEELVYHVDIVLEEINSMMDAMNRSRTRLNAIELRPDPLFAVEHIDLLIHFEKLETNPGYMKRIDMLSKFRHMALVDQTVEVFKKNIQETKENIRYITGKSFGIDNA